MIYSYILLVTFFHVVLLSPITASDETTTAESIKYKYFESGYTIIPGIGAHKYHTTPVNWNTARKICISEGAHLAVINSALEETIIAKYQVENNDKFSWLGYHDQFENRNWVTVMDQPIDAIGYVHWRENEPNNAGDNEHCVVYGLTGMNDLDCNRECPFLCKMYLN